MNKKSYYYRNDDYKKIPINLQIDFSDHANMRLNQRELSKYEAKSAIEKGLSSICRLNHSDDFKLYSMRWLFSAFQPVFPLRSTNPPCGIPLCSAFNSSSLIK